LIIGVIDRKEIDTGASYFEDPKRALEKFVEENDCELSISCKQANGSSGEYNCSLEINGLQGPFSAKGSGKKANQAERDACVEACYKLEQLGILHMSNIGESYQQRRKRLLEFVGNDDDDDFLDLTVAKATKKARNDEQVETLETLHQKYVEKLKEVQVLSERKAKIGTIIPSESQNVEDELDQFMDQLQKKEQKVEIKTIEKDLTSAQNELRRIEKLLKIVAPSNYVYPTIESIKQEAMLETARAKTKHLETNKSIPHPISQEQSANLRIHQESQDIVGSKSTMAPQVDAKKIMPSREEMMKHMVETEDVVELVSTRVESDKVAKLREKYGY
jgi:hypothetical protein